MKKRRPMSRKASKKNFTRNAQRTSGKNLRGRPMRGGFRL